MADTNQDSQLYEAFFGGVRLWLTNLSVPLGRTMIVHEPSEGPNYAVDDRGPELPITRCGLLFAWMPRFDTLSPLERLNAFRAVVDDNPRTFRNPLLGSYRARVGAFNVEIDEHENFTVEGVEFYPVGDLPTVTDPGFGVTSSGSFNAEVAAKAAAASYAAIRMQSDLPQRVSAAVSTWASGPLVNPQTVIADTAALTSELGDQAELLDDRLETWEAFKSTIVLADAVYLAASAQLAESGSTFAVEIGSAVALRALVAKTYPGEDIGFRFEQVMQLNDIPNPGLLDVGRVVYFPMKTAQQRRR